MKKLCSIFLFMCLSVGSYAQDLLPYYQKQQTDSSCSLASATMVVNAMLSSQQPLKQSEVLALTQSVEWTKAVAPGGEGLNLYQLQLEVQNLLQRLSLDHTYQVKLVRMNESLSSQQFLKALQDLKSKSSWIIMNFDQGIVKGNGSYGHFSPVGRWDARHLRLLVLDTDPAYAPYWINLKTAFNAMNTIDTEAGLTRGFLWIVKKNDTP